MSAAEHDYPLEIAGAHGRIDAYRAALRIADSALVTAMPYVNGVRTDPHLSPWRKETAEQSFETIREARDRIAAELAVTTP
jgi:hypothetical protein